MWFTVLASQCHSGNLSRCPVLDLHSCWTSLVGAEEATAQTVLGVLTGTQSLELLKFVCALPMSLVSGKQQGHCRDLRWTRAYPPSQTMNMEGTLSYYLWLDKFGLLKTTAWFPAILRGLRDILTVNKGSSFSSSGPYILSSMLPPEFPLKLSFQHAEAFPTQSPNCSTWYPMSGSKGSWTFMISSLSPFYSL